MGRKQSWCQQCRAADNQEILGPRKLITRSAGFFDLVIWRISIEFLSSTQRRIKADQAKLEGGVLVLYVYTTDRRMLPSTGSFPIQTIKWARLGKMVLIGDPKR
jgi:hypothetical protein